LLLPAALFLSALIVKYLAPDAEGHGTEKIIEAVHKHSGKIRPMVVPVKLVATIITIAFGGSAGKEGPAAQIGAAVTSVLSTLLRFDDRDRKKLVICGISAGFATVFGTPIAGAIFGVEVLFVGGMLYEVLLPSFVAGIVGYQISSTLGVTYFHEPLKFVPVFSSLFFMKVCAAGIFFGFCSLLLIETLRLFERVNHHVKIWSPLQGILGGSLLVILSLIFSTRYLGLGLDTITHAIAGGTVPGGAFVLKILFTAITLSFGGSGGIITPIFFIGAAAGNVFGSVLGLDVSVFSAIGMISLLAGAANTPISASIMAIELFGPAIGPYAAVACVISFLMTGHRSVYPSQVLSLTKSSSLIVEHGREMKDIGNVAYQPRPKSVSEMLMKGLKKIKKEEKQ
jgi:H+/Cl- antiporter ClcA